MNKRFRVWKKESIHGDWHVSLPGRQHSVYHFETLDDTYEFIHAIRMQEDAAYRKAWLAWFDGEVEKQVTAMRYQDWMRRLRRRVA